MPAHAAAGKRSDAASAVAVGGSHLPLTALATAATVLLFGLMNLFVLEDTSSTVNGAVEVACAFVLLGIAYHAARPGATAHANAIGVLLLVTLAVAATATLSFAKDANSQAYVALFLIFAAFLVLSWAWFAAAMGVGLAMALALNALGAPVLVDLSGMLLLLSGAMISAILHMSRLRVARKMEATFHEVSEARTKAQSAEMRLRAVFDANPAGLLVADARTLQILQANRSMQQMLGFGPDEMLGMTTGQLVDPASLALHREKVDQLAREGGFVESDRLFRRRDGTLVRTRVRAVRGQDAPGADAWVLGNIEDVTEQRAREERLLMQSHALASIGQAVVVTDLEGRVTFWNRAAERIYGWSAAEAVGRHVLDLTPTQGSAPDAALIFERLKAGASWSGDFELRRKDGSTFLARVTDSPLLDADDKLVGIIGISEDITERKRTEEALRRAERDAALGTLVAGVAHEINNPLQFMGGHLDLLEIDVKALEQSPGLGEEQREELAAIEGDIAVIRKGLDQVAHVTRALRQVAKRTDGPRKVERLAPLIDTVLATARPRMGPDVDVALKVDPDAQAFASAEAVVQVLLNLVLNAGEAMEGRGILTIRTVAEGEEMAIEVEDSGKGIPPEAVARIFTPFFTTKPEGTGLGLSISRRLAQDQGGDLTFESRPGRTVFRLTLPLAPRREEGPMRA